MNWHDLQHLLALSEHGTLPEAANALQVNRTTVSRRIANLEADLRTQLVVKLGRDLALTPSGHDVVAAARMIEGEVQNLERRLFGRDHDLAGIVRITATPAIASMLGEGLAKFGLAHPDLVLEVSATNAVEDLELMESDIAIRLTFNPPNELIGHQVAKPTTAFYASTAVASRLDSNTTIDYIDGTLSERNFDHVRQWIESEFNRPYAVVARTSSMELAMQLVAAGRGVAALPCYVADQIPNLARVSARREDLLPPIWILYHPRHRKTARIRATTEHLLSTFTTLTDIFSGTEAG